MSTLIGIVNKGMLCALLLLFFASRLLGDYPVGSPPWHVRTPTDLANWLVGARRNLLFSLDVFTAMLTLPLFWGYVRLKSRPEAELRDGIARVADQATANALAVEG